LVAVRVVIVWLYVRQYLTEVSIFHSEGVLMLKAEVQAKILSLFLNEKKSIRAIANAIGIDRKTVNRIIKRKQVALDRQRAVRPSLLDP
jgi:predicted transcriptional regulator